MPEKNAKAATVRFENFELDLRSGELRREGVQEPIRLPEQPFLILTLLLQRQGQVVGRDEIRSRLWPEDTNVEFENSISAAMARLRQVLGDSANDPRYIETLARRGYRWKIPPEWDYQDQDIGSPEGQAIPMAPESSIRSSVKIRILLTLLLTVSATCLWLLWPRGKTRTDIKIVQATSMPGFEWGPTFSPDGREIAFIHADNIQSTQSLYLKALDDEKISTITKDLGRADCPNWAPDGKLIAYTQFDDSGAAIFLVTPLGGSRREFRHLSQTSTCQTSWSSDSKSLAYANAPGTEGSGIFVAAVEPGVENRITTAPSGSMDSDPAFSPKGDRLAFLRGTSLTSRDLYIVSTRDHRERQLTFLNAGLESPQWAIDGKRILFCLNPGVEGERSLFTVDVAGGQPERVPFISSDAATPALAPDGHGLAYVAASFDANIWKVSLGDSTGVASHAASGNINAQVVIASSRLDFQPQVSPDGSRLVFVSDRDGSLAVWVSALDGTNALRLVSAPGTGSPKWSPDGKFIVFDSLASGRRELFVVSANGGTPVQITTNDSENEVGSWSSDGRWIYFTSNRSSPWQIWKKSRIQSDSPPVQVTTNGGAYAQESPDGKFVYFQKRTDDNVLPRIWRISAAGGNEEPVTDCPTWFWEVRRDGVYCIANNPAPVVKLFRFDTGRTQVLSQLKAEAWGGPGLSLSNDGKTAFYSQMDSAGSDIMLIKGFRLP